MQEIAELDAMAKKTTVQGFSERVQTSGVKDSMANAVVGIVDLNKELEEDINRCRMIQNDIKSVIEQLPTAEYELLYKIYIELKELYIAAVEMEKSYSWASKKHRKAIKSVQAILDERQNDE